MAKTKQPAAGAMFAAKGGGEIYAALIASAQTRLGASNAIEDPKQTCVHLTAGKGRTAFAGFHPRKGAVLVNVRVSKPIRSPRVRKTEQLSANRWHCEFLVGSPADVDGELVGWIEEAFRLAAG